MTGEKVDINSIWGRLITIPWFFEKFGYNINDLERLNCLESILINKPSNNRGFFHILYF